MLAQKLIEGVELSAEERPRLISYSVPIDARFK